MNPAAAIGALWQYLLLHPIEWLLEHLHSIFAAFGPTKAIGAFGLGVIVVTLIIRAVLFPLFGWQLRSSRRTQAEQRRIAPELQELRKKYKKDPQKLNAEMMKLYKEHGISPFSGLIGCVPLLIQYPILIALYQGIRGVTGTLHQDLGFLWIHNVTQTSLDVCCQVFDKTGKAVTGDHSNYFVGALTHPASLILPLMSAVATVVQSKMMMQPSRPDMSDQERQAYNISKQMTYLMPVMVFIFGMLFPQGIAIYWVTQSLFMIVQQYYVIGWGSLPVPQWFPGAHRVTALSFPSQRAALAGSGAGAGGGRTATPSPERGRGRQGGGGGERRGGNGRGQVPPSGPRQRPPAGAGSRSQQGGARRRRGR